jgi:hypothetical protein
MKTGPLLRNRYLLVLVCLILLTIPFFKINNAVIGLFVAYGFYRIRRENRALQTNDLLLFLPALMVAAYLIGLLWSSDLFEGWKQVEKRLPLLVLPFGFFLHRSHLEKKDIVFLFHFFVMLCLALSVVCYSNALYNIILHDSFKVVEELERDYYYFSYLPLTNVVGIEPMYLSLAANLSVCFLLARPFRNKALNLLLVLYLGFFVFLIASKIGIISLAAMLCLYALSRVGSHFARLTVSAAIALIFIVIIYNSDFLRERFTAETNIQYDRAWAGDWNSFTQRLAIWSCALETVAGSPWGYGTADGQIALDQTYERKGYIRGYEDHYNAHSEFLYTLLDLGAFGLAVLFVVILYPVFAAWKFRQHLLLYFLILFVLYFLVEVVLARRYGIMLFAFWYPLIIMDSGIAERKPSFRS